MLMLGSLKCVLLPEYLRANASTTLRVHVGKRRSEYEVFNESTVMGQVLWVDELWDV